MVLPIISQTMKKQFRCYLGEDGASGRIRTSDRSVRSRVLYPAELRMHRELLITTDTAKKMVHPGGLLGCASPCGPLLKQRYPPWARDYLADHETTVLLLPRRIWCIREDSNLRPLGS